MVRATDPRIIGQNLPLLLALFACGLGFDRLRFFAVVPVGADLPASVSGSLAGIFDWAAILLVGPSALWLSMVRGILLWLIPQLPNRRTRANSHLEQWDRTRNSMLSFALITLGGTSALTIYQALGGVFPIDGLMPQAALVSLLAVLSYAVVRVVLILPYGIYLGRASALGIASSRTKLFDYLAFFGVGMIVPLIIDSFGVLLAGLYAQNGPFAAGFLIVGMLAASATAHQLSRSVEGSGDRSRELAALEALAKAILAAPPDGSKLPDVLERFVPSMFRYSTVEIRLLNGHVLLNHRHAADTDPTPIGVWDWIRINPAPHIFKVGEVLPWSQRPARNPMLVIPIHEIDPDDEGGQDQTLIGGFYLARQFTSENDDIRRLMPAAQSLVNQVQSALYAVTSHRHALELQKIDQELAFASQIQRSFLPSAVPQPTGWQFDAILEPARQTSGDFYDFFALPDGKIGLVIADVADKGVGAALYMALVRTLIRTYAVEVEQPAQLLESVNRRILADARADLFVTVFYATLDPRDGLLAYGNAGHNPPLLFAASPDSGVRCRLLRTGIPLGMFEDMHWEQATVSIAPGELLTIYTDGLTEAQNRDEAQFGEARVIEAVSADVTRSADQLSAEVLASVHGFIGTAAQFDDITLVILLRCASH
jgi:serine phosphatase RsbU (regulator of sigma subunit)